MLWSYCDLLNQAQVKKSVCSCSHDFGGWDRWERDRRGRGLEGRGRENVCACSHVYLNMCICVHIVCMLLKHCFEDEMGKGREIVCGGLEYHFKDEIVHRKDVNG